MNITDLKKYIGLTDMMIIATIDESGNPYTANVYFRLDEKGNFYFQSKPSREHSKHIEQDSNIAWSILNTQLYTPQSKDKKGLQFQGIAKMLTGEEMKKIDHEIYGKNRSILEIMQSGHMYYKCVPRRVKIWDETLYGGDGKSFNIGE